ncbi:MAG: tRNA (adenosine(37)-N6)-threonylcarbamoyltransferase complex ATPase subunit type 1 TsaE [Candidatus Saccharimonadales bacterium]
MKQEVNGEDAMRQFGATIGGLLTGGEVIELVGDVGAGKTTLTKGIAVGMRIDETVQSPSFTISRLYEAPSGVKLAHYDFYRLIDAGIMANDLQETVSDPRIVTIIEWAAIVDGVLPIDRLTITITSPAETVRRIAMTAGGEMSQRLLEKLA